MAWVELSNRRTRRSKVFQDSADARRFAVDGHLTALHYESQVDSGVFDATIDMTSIRTNNARFDGWRITQNGWHYALGIDKVNYPGEDGWVGFGGRGGANWFKFRLERVGYIHWPSRAVTPIGGIASYVRSGNLSRVTKTLTVESSGELINVEQVITWANLWVTPGGGAVTLRWRANGDGLKEEIIVNQAARSYFNSLYPGTPQDETYFCFVFRLDTSEISKWTKHDIEQSISGDFDDDNGESSIKLLDNLGRLLAFLPVDYAYVLNTDGLVIGRQRLRKRIFREGGIQYLVIGAVVDQLNTLPQGDLVFDPTVDADVGASADDFEDYEYIGFFVSNDINNQVGHDGGGSTHFGVRFTGITLSGTITASYVSGMAASDQTSTPAIRISGVDSDNPSPPTSDSEFNSLPLTTAYVDWTPGSWTGSNWYQSPSLNSIVQELVDTYTISSDAIIFVFRDNGSGTGNYRRLRTYDFGASSAPKLHIEYSTAAAASLILRPRNVNTLIRM